MSSYLISVGRAAVLLQQNSKSWGGNKGSIATQNELSSIQDITHVNNGHGSSKHGFVLHSIKYTLKSLSIIKSNP